MKRLLLALSVGALTLGVMACGSGVGDRTSTGDEAADTAARPVSTEEAQLLAITRFQNFDQGSRGFNTSVQERGIDLQLQGWVDYEDHFGYAAVTGDFPPQALVWTASTVGVTEQQPDTSGNPILPVPSLADPAFATATIDPAASRLDALLAVIGSLGSDRPDNPLLLQQSGALWLRDDLVGDIAVTVFAAPPSDAPRDASSPPLKADTSSLRLWVDGGGMILRAEARIGDTWCSIDFSDAAGVQLSLPPGALDE